MIKNMTLGYTGMSQDMSKSLADPSKYFSATNIRITSTDKQSTFSLTNEKGNELLLTIPQPIFSPIKTRIEWTDPFDGSTKLLNYYIDSSDSIPRNELERTYSPSVPPNTFQSATQVIVGTCDTRDGAILATTDSNGWDCIWELTGMDSESFAITLKYMRNLGWSSSTLVQFLYNYENSVIEKIYFVDGTHQLRYLNLRQSKDNGDLLNLIDVDSSSVNIVGKFDVSQPTISSINGGGTHTSGMIQYAYNLYVLNGAQTTISPLSEIIPLDKGDGLGGGEVNEVVGRTVVVEVPNVDENFTHIKLYSIKYTSYNSKPKVSLIADREIDRYDTFSYYDDGNILEDVSIEEFVFLGSSPLIPKHIESKDSRLFAFNVREHEFEVDLDTRCYGHKSDGTCVIMENVTLVNDAVQGVDFTVNTSDYLAVDPKHDSICKDYDVYNRLADNSAYGAEGEYFKVSFDQSALSDPSTAEDKRFFKDREVYRIGIKFFNDLGQETFPMWMCDLKAPEGNLSGNYNKLKVEIKAAFTTWLNNTTFGDNQEPVGYMILRADRTLSDRTILCQGMLNPMVANDKHNGAKRTAISPSGFNYTLQNQVSKMPSLTRTFTNENPIRGMTAGKPDYRELSENQSNGWGITPYETETITSCAGTDFRAQTYQFNRMMQMFSPEVLFEIGVETDSTHKLNIVGMQRKSATESWVAEYDPVSKQNKIEAKFQDGINSGTTGVTVNSIKGSAGDLMDRGLFGPTDSSDYIQLVQIYREFQGTFVSNTGVKEWEVYGNPEVTERGAGFKNYNNDARLRYCNNLQSLLIDDWNDCSNVNSDAAQQILGANSWGERCITFVQGPDTAGDDGSWAGRKTLSSMRVAANIGATDGVLIGEFKKKDQELYLGNIYGGSSYEAKSVSTYMSIGSYVEFDSAPHLNTLTIESPGDTYVQNFTFAKLVKTDTEVNDRSQNQVIEIVSFPVETTVDLKNRNDFSLSSWDNKWQPSGEEYNKYNKVYSQQPTLIQVTDPGFKFKKVQEFDTRIIATGEKISGEFIDSWTDFLENEQMHLDGKYGPINGIVNMKDNIYTLQNSALAGISINPRVQTTGDDGIEVQLGTGKVLHDYRYISTKSGCLNKWSIVSSESAFYYFDVINQAIMRFAQNGLEGISDKEGMHSYFKNNTSYNQLYQDNPLSGYGVSTGYNSVNNDVYFTFRQATFNDGSQQRIPDYANDLTIAYNEATGTFTSFYSYTPPLYITKGGIMLTANASGSQLWRHFSGTANNFYGIQKDSDITFNVAPKGSGKYTFNNLKYKMELEDANGNELRDNSLTHVWIWNEYQNSLLKPLTLRENLKRRNREWNITLPRDFGTRNRIKSPWAFLYLKLYNADGKEMVLHNLNLSYTEH